MTDAAIKSGETSVDTLPPIETDALDPSREYIPLPAGWEIQTKGRGSSYRLLDRKTEQRHSIGMCWSDIERDFVTRMAKEIHAGYVDDLRVVEESAGPPRPKPWGVQPDADAPGLYLAFETVAERDQCAAWMLKSGDA